MAPVLQSLRATARRLAGGGDVALPCAAAVALPRRSGAYASIAAEISLPLAGGREGEQGIDPEVVELVRQAQDGSAQAFALLYDRYVDNVFAYVFHRVGHRQTAEDLVGDVFLRALQRISTFKWQGVDVGAWLMTIARNRVHDHFKSARFRLESSVDEFFDSPAIASPDDPEQAAVSADIARQVQQALRQLKGEQAEVLYLRFVQHLDVAQTATVMGKNSGAVKALQYRALKSLAKLVPEGLVTA